MTTFCLNMIVRDEAHVVHEVLDSVAPYISYWVIVDTGSTDGTQKIIKRHMKELGIPGELHERPWVDFGHNRTQALQLAQGKADYIWLMDADDTITGTPDLAHLDADVYTLRTESADSPGFVIWTAKIFRDGLPVRYVGKIHEQPAYERTPTIERVEGDYHVGYRMLGGRDRDRDIALLLDAIERDPADAISVFHLAKAYFGKHDYANAHKWLVRRTEMGGSDEEIYVSLYLITEALSGLEAPWPDVRRALLDAWEYRPTRAEAVFELARLYRESERYEQGYQLARITAEMPCPDDDSLFVRTDIHAWRATEEQLICATMLGRRAEAFTLSRDVLARAAVPDQERQRIAHNRDLYSPAMVNAAAQYYPEEPAQRLQPSPGQPSVLISLVAVDRARTEYTLNSLLNCCTDIARMSRFVIHDTGLSDSDRAALRQRYRFLEFGPVPQTRYRLDLGEGWLFFAPDNLLTRLIAVLEAEPTVAHVGINYRDATALTGTCAPETEVRRAPGTGRYVLAPTPLTGPAMTDTTRTGTGYATLDEVLCLPNPEPAPEPARTTSRYIAL